MEFDLRSASDYRLPDLVKLMNRGFENYFIPIQFNVSALLAMLRKDSVDLSASRVLLVDKEPSGIALIARRGPISRLAAMGISEGMRGRSAGTWFMEKLVMEARERQEHEMVLEVIEQNEPAVRLYQNYGFQIVRRLMGWIHKDASENETSDLQELDLGDMARLISQYGLSNLPWQISGETIALMTHPARAYRKGQAYAVISDPSAEHIVIWSLLVETPARGNSLGADILKSLIAHHAGRIWHIPAIFPEEFGKVFEHAGFEREELSQWQMRLPL
ncbi:MAG TPA: GNAT family N-acetyltransferase [Anaerolineales bacterium]